MPVHACCTLHVDARPVKLYYAHHSYPSKRLPRSVTGSVNAVTVNLKRLGYLQWAGRETLMRQRQLGILVAAAALCVAAMCAISGAQQASTENPQSSALDCQV